LIFSRKIAKLAKILVSRPMCCTFETAGKRWLLNQDKPKLIGSGLKGYKQLKPLTILIGIRNIRQNRMSGTGL